MLLFKGTTIISRCYLVLFVALGMLLPGISSEVHAEGRDDSWAPVTFLYLSDVKGLIEPCG